VSGSMGISSPNVGREWEGGSGYVHLPVNCCPNAGGLDGCARKVEGALDEGRGRDEGGRPSDKVGRCVRYAAMQRHGSTSL
jgi:hypothetical protein